MTEDVSEEFATRFQPIVNAPKKPAVVANVLEHFHGHHAFEVLLGGEDVYVCGDDFEIGEIAGFRLRDNVFPLGMRVGN